MKKKICIIGLGYVGLAMSVLCSMIKQKKDYRFNVYGLEKNNKNGRKIIASLKKKKTSI